MAYTSSCLSGVHVLHLSKHNANGMLLLTIAFSGNRESCSNRACRTTSPHKIFSRTSFNTSYNIDRPMRGTSLSVALPWTQPYLSTAFFHKGGQAQIGCAAKADSIMQLSFYRSEQSIARNAPGLKKLCPTATLPQNQRSTLKEGKQKFHLRDCRLRNVVSEVQDARHAQAVAEFKRTFRSRQRYDSGI